MHLPLVLSSFAARGQWAIGAGWSKRWVESRLVPQSRQNLGEVLRENGLDSYDTLRLLEMTDGRNSQDDCFLTPLRLADCPEWYRERESARVVEAVALQGRRLLVAFRTDEVRLYESEELAMLDDGFSRIAESEAVFERVEVATGGRGVRWGSVVVIDDDRLRHAGTSLPLSWNDLSSIAPSLLVDSSEAANMLGCTRQNLHALAKRGSLPVAKSSGKATLFLRADIRARRASGDAGFPKAQD